MKATMNHSDDVLTPAQLRVYLAICDHWRRHGYSPSYRDLCARLVLSPNGVKASVLPLRRKGLLAPVAAHRGARCLAPTRWPMPA